MDVSQAEEVVLSFSFILFRLIANYTLKFGIILILFIKFQNSSYSLNARYCLDLFTSTNVLSLLVSIKH